MSVIEYNGNVWGLVGYILICIAVCNLVAGFSWGLGEILFKHAKNKWALFLVKSSFKKGRH